MCAVSILYIKMLVHVVMVKTVFYGEETCDTTHIFATEKDILLFIQATFAIPTQTFNISADL